MKNRTLGTLAAAAITVVLAGPAKDAAAMPVATSNQLGLADPAASVEKTVLVCGPWACYWRPGYWYRPYPYWGWRRHYWWGRPGWGWRRPGWGWRRW